jgi:CheY-like chemotaxis protein
MTAGFDGGQKSPAHEDIFLTNQLLHAARVLLVEDEFLIAMDVEQLCRDHGAQEVRVVASHTELHPELLAGSRFDVAILDVKVQGKWTMDFARLLVKREIPFIFATGYSDVETFFSDFPGAPVVSKPYTGVEVMEALSAAMAARSVAGTMPPTA